jgi:hypothetical protein
LEGLKISGSSIKKIGWAGIDWIDLARRTDQLGAFEHGNETSGASKKKKIF